MLLLEELEHFPGNEPYKIHIDILSTHDSTLARIVFLHQKFKTVWRQGQYDYEMLPALLSDWYFLA